MQDKAYELTSQDDKVEASEIHILMSNEEETDTRVILCLNYAVELGYKSAVVRTPDTDIFFLLLHYALDVKLKIYLQTGERIDNYLIFQVRDPLSYIFKMYFGVF